MDALNQLHTEMRACRLCLEAGHDIVPGAIFGSGTERRVMLIGQAPGVTEVAAQRPFNATSGTRLFQWLGEAGWAEDEFRARHYMTAVTKCYPGKAKNGKGDRVPSKAEQALCRPFLERELALVNPRLIIPVGGLAIKLFYPNSARLKNVIGTAVYFPPDSLTNPVNFNLKEALPVQWDGEQLTVAGNQLSVTGGPISNPQFPNPKSQIGRFLIPLPHPSGASLWPNKPENQKLIRRAISMLAALRTAWQL